MLSGKKSVDGWDDRPCTTGIVADAGVVSRTSASTDRSYDRSCGSWICLLVALQRADADDERTRRRRADRCGRRSSIATFTSSLEPVADQLAAHGVEVVGRSRGAGARARSTSCRSTVLRAGPMLTHPDGYPLDAWGHDGYGIGCGDAACVTATVDRLASEGARVIKIAGDDDGLADALMPVAVAGGARASPEGRDPRALGCRRARGWPRRVATSSRTRRSSRSARATVAAWRGRAVISTLAAFGGSDGAVENLRALRAAGADRAVRHRPRQHARRRTEPRRGRAAPARRSRRCRDHGRDDDDAARVLGRHADRAARARGRSAPRCFACCSRLAASAPCDRRSVRSVVILVLLARVAAAHQSSTKYVDLRIDGDARRTSRCAASRATSPSRCGSRPMRSRPRSPRPPRRTFPPTSRAGSRCACRPTTVRSRAPARDFSARAEDDGFIAVTWSVTCVAADRHLDPRLHRVLRARQADGGARQDRRRCRFDPRHRGRQSDRPRCRAAPAVRVHAPSGSRSRC